MEKSDKEYDRKYIDIGQGEFLSEREYVNNLEKMGLSPLLIADELQYIRNTAKGRLK